MQNMQNNSKLSSSISLISPFNLQGFVNDVPKQSFLQFFGRLVILSISQPEK